jgi:hypothetical protein
MLNPKLKFLLYSTGIFTSTIILINTYKLKYTTLTINLNEIDIQANQNLRLQNDNPFELINNFNIDEYQLNQIGKALYNPPLTNKLYPRSNLYGHELIRYFDF